MIALFPSQIADIADILAVGPVLTSKFLITESAPQALLNLYLIGHVPTVAVLGLKMFPPIIPVPLKTPPDGLAVSVSLSPSKQNTV